jgi:sulfur carrier protein ThiS adenylyltransferase
MQEFGDKVVGIMGLGGLGSAVAVALARSGVGRLRLADFDRIERHNLQRQYYFSDQVGELKTTALLENIGRINSGIKVEVINERLTSALIVRYFKDVDVLVECFDQAEMKATALRTVLTEMERVAYVGASGVAGCGESNLIKTGKIMKGVYLVGDNESEVGPRQRLVAARVGIAAHHQANQVLRILLGKEDGR